MTTYFIADLHLNEAQPEITTLFLRFMQEQAPHADALYILGDLFDFWIGDDERSELIDRVKTAIYQLTSSGIPCYFICGNRDFLLGKRFARETGMVLLPDYDMVNLYGKKTLICHGDTLCIDDRKYQQFRQRVHQKWLQKLFLWLPLWLRLNIARKIRAKSQADKSAKSLEIMDINPEFTAQVVSQFGAEWLIHGHTHKQGVHYEGGKISGETAPLYTRIVLGDWGKTASILKVTPKGFTFNENRND